MAETTAPNLPAVPELGPGELSPHSAETLLSIAHLPISLQIFFNEDLFNRCKQVAGYLAKADGFAPRHLIGKPEACFAVVSRALTWRLDPYAVGQACYMTPGGQIGYYGSLCQAILENSGRLIGGVKFELQGDWSKLQGKFKIVTNDKGNKYPAASWEQYGEIERGLGVIVRAKMRGEEMPREMPFELVQAYPRNSTLWATDPRTQIQYTAVRRFATSTVPTLFMGVPFDHEDLEDWVAAMRDVTPARPELADETPRRGRRRAAAAEAAWQGDGAEGEARAAPAETQGEASSSSSSEPARADEGETLEHGTSGKPPFSFVDEDGVLHEFATLDAAGMGLAQQLEKVSGNVKAIKTVWENSAELLDDLKEAGDSAAIGALTGEYDQLLAEAEKKSPDQTAGAPTPATEQKAAAPGYEVEVPLLDKMPMNQWHMAARAKLKEMTDVGRPPVDFTRFREVNKAALDRLSVELRSWATMLQKAIAEGEARGQADG